MQKQFLRLQLASLILIFGGFSLDISAQELSNDFSIKLKRLVRDIAKEDMVTGSAVGYSGEMPEQWKRFEELLVLASNSELIELTNNLNAVVRCYAFHALCLRNDTSCYSILLNHLTDNEYVSTFFGCIQDGEPVGDYFLGCCYPGYNEHSFALSDNQIHTVDSILIYNPNVRLLRKRLILKTLKPEEEYYSRIKEIATIEANTSAIVALARFQNQQDTGLILNYLISKEKSYQYWGIYAAREFPDSVFYDKLVEIFQTDWKKSHYNYPKWRILYQALAKYPNETTLKLFEKTVRLKIGFKYQTLGKYLLIAIDKYPQEIYNPIREKIKLNDYHMDDYHYEYDVED